MERTKDLDMVQRIKKAEKKAKMSKSAVVVVPVEASTETTISFDVWWVATAKALNLQAYIKEIVWADFKSRDLKKEEPVVKYNEALRLFGYKV